MYAGSDFMTLRTGSDRTIEEVLLQVAKHVEDGCYKIISISASAASFVVVLSTRLSRKELAAKGFPWPAWKEGEKKGEGEVESA